MQRVISFLRNERTLLVIYILVTVVASLHLVYLGNTHTFEGVIFGESIPRKDYTHYNNYVIFKQSFYHLIDGKDLYKLYPTEQWDLYKYSPTFALAMGLLAPLPDAIGLILWNLVNSLGLFFAIKMLPFDKKPMAGALWFVLLELLTAVQGTQSNALLAALVIGAWAFMERKKVIWATLLLVAATYIKVYGAVGFAFFLFYPQKPKFILYSAMWTVLFTIAPLVVISPQNLLMQYQSWVHMMSMDQSISYGLSVSGWLYSWFGVTGGKGVVLALGILGFLLPLVRYKQYAVQHYRLLFLAFTLVWVIIFNHKAESSTFVIAIAGVAIWYFSQHTHNLAEKVMLWLAFIFTCLSPTDVFPPTVRHEIMVPYMLKVVPCIIIWVWLLIKMLGYKQSHSQAPVN